MPLLRFIPEATKIDFVGARYVAFAVDGLLLLASIFAIAWYGFNLGIDFTGGVLMEVKSAQVIDIGKIRGQIDGLHYGEAQIQYFGGGQCDVPVNSCAMIRIQPRLSGAESDQDAADQRVTNAIKKALGPSFEFRNTQIIGPAVSEELLHDGIYATLLAVLMIGIYVSVRFEWQYGIGAAISTGHDVLVTAGLFSLLGLSFDLNAVAALLTLAGYSINDTVVVFDRIRENRRKYKRMGLRDLINLSTNQTLTRTVLTSVATAVSLIPLLLFGGPTLFDFSAAILFGIVVGTFSSVYIAAVLLLYLPAPAGQVEDAKGETATA